MCVLYLSLKARSRQTNYTIWISTSIFPRMHSFRLQNRSWLLLQFMLKSLFSSEWLDIILFRAVFTLPEHSLHLLYIDLCLIQLLWSEAFFFVGQLESVTYCRPWVRLWGLLVFPPSFKIYLNASSTSLLHSVPKTMCYTTWLLSISCQDTSRLCGQDKSLCCLALFNALTEF